MSRYGDYISEVTILGMTVLTVNPMFRCGCD